MPASAHSRNAGQLSEEAERMRSTEPLSQLDLPHEQIDRAESRIN